MNCDWELSQSFISDGQGIRVACVLPPAPTNDDNSPDLYRIITGTQGGTLIEYMVPSGNLNVIQNNQHNHSITAIIASPDKTKYVTGCKDSIIRIYNSSTHILEGTIQGHEKAVTSFDIFEMSGVTYLLSGSWDGTCKIWNLNNKSLITTLSNHENTVSVCYVGNSNTNNVINIVTGSAGYAENNVIKNHTIRLWTINVQTSDQTLVHSVSNDHDGPIRDLTLLGKGGGGANNIIASCSNDGTVHLRSTIDGKTISTLMSINVEQQQHPPILLSVTSLPSSQDDDGKNCTVVASAEDGNVILWNINDNGTQPQEPQHIRHTQCVWSTIGLSNGDIVTCCQDGMLRIFTQCSERYATQEERTKFHNDVRAAHEKKSSGPSQEEISKLPKWELNSLTKGRSEGQVQIFNKDNIAIAAQWSMSSQTWIEVGQVMGSKGGDDQDGGGDINGVSYDHILPIEVDTPDGSVAKLRIGYNVGENPFVAAQRFIDEHMLPQYHLSQIADYIQQRVGSGPGPTLGMGGSGSAGGGSATSATPSAAVTGIPQVSYEYIPMLPKDVYKSFDLSDKTAKTTLEKIYTKICGDDNGHPQLKSSDKDKETLHTLIATIEKTNRYHSSKISDDELKLIIKLLQQQDGSSLEHIFPIIDLCRMIILHPDSISNNRIITCWIYEIIPLILQTCTKLHESDNVGKTEGIAIPMLSLRFFANCFKSGVFSSSLAAAVDSNTKNKIFDDILSLAKKYINSSNKNIRLSVVTVLLNLSSYLHYYGDVNSSSSCMAIVDIINDIISNHVTAALYKDTPNDEIVIRLLSALGTICLSTTNNSNTNSSKTTKDYASSLLKTNVEYFASTHNTKCKSIAKEVYSILS